jgi:hypothetical protein
LRASLTSAFSIAADLVSARVNDLSAIAYRNAAAFAAISLDVLRCCRPTQNQPLGATKGGTAHRSSIEFEIATSGICLNVW